MVDWERRLIRFEYVIENGKVVDPYMRSLDAQEQPAAQCVNFASELLINSLSIDTRDSPDSVLRLTRDDDDFCTVMLGTSQCRVPPCMYQ